MAIGIQLVLLFLESIFCSSKLVFRLLPFLYQALTVLLQFFCLFVQLCFTGRQLFFSFGQFLTVILQLCPGFCHLPVCAFLLMGKCSFSIGQLLSGFVDIIPGIGKFPVCFRKLVICGIFGILNLCAGFPDDRIITCFFPLFLDPVFNIRYDGLHPVIIFIGIGVHFLRSVQGKIYRSEHIEVGILLCDKKRIIAGVSGPKEAACAIAVLNVHGVQYHTGNGISRIGKGGRLRFLQLRFHIFQINICVRNTVLLWGIFRIVSILFGRSGFTFPACLFVFCNGQRITQGAAAFLQIFLCNGGFPFFCRHLAIQQIGFVQAFAAQHHHVRCFLHSGCLRMNDFIVASFRSLHSFQPRKGIHILLCQSQSGDNPDVKQVLPVKEPVRRIIHVRTGGIQSGQHSNTQCRNNENGKEPFPPFLNGASDVFTICFAHRLTTQSQKSGPDAHFARYRLLSRF